MRKNPREIIDACGGPSAIAAKSCAFETSQRVSAKAVYDWQDNGIPEKRWPIIMSLTDITEAELHAANEAVRTKKKGSEMQSEAHAA